VNGENIPRTGSHHKTSCNKTRRNDEKKPSSKKDELQRVHWWGGGGGPITVTSTIKGLKKTEKRNKGEETTTR